MTNSVDKQYIDLIKYILENGTKKDDRTGTGTISIFDYTMRFNLAEGFPLLTTKKLHFKSIAIELLWFLRGDTNIKFLQDNGVKIWDSWVNEDKYIGKTYGYQWTNWDFSVNQIEELIFNLKNNPDSRRHLVSAWNPSDNKRLALPPCHYAMQFYIANNKLSCKFNMRASDTFLGLPFNIASYALLTHMIAKQCNLEVGELIWSGGDVHIYQNHLEQVNEQIKREPFELPKLNIKRKPDSIFDYKFEDFEVLNYKAHPSIKAKVAI